MPDEHNPDGWTFATLYKHVMALSDAAKEATSTAMKAAELASDKADRATEKRFDSVNEFRNAMKDQQTNFADKEATDRRLAALEETRNKNEGKAQGISSVGALIIGGSMVLASAIAAAGFAMSVVRGH